MMENIALEEVDGITNAVIQCTMCESIHRVQVNPEAFRAWRKGKWAQDAFPEMDAEKRELFISGVCGPCFKRLFGEEEE